MKNLIEDWLDKNGTKEINKEVEMEALKNSKLILEFEILEGITSNQFDTKDWNKFDRFVEIREKENEEDLSNVDNWEFEISSGYAGYRNTMTGDWIYEKEYLDRFNEREVSPEEETLEKIKFVLLSNNNAQAIRHIESYGFWREEKIRKETYRRVFTQEDGWQDQRVYTEQEVREMLIKLHNEFPDKWFKNNK